MKVDHTRLTLLILVLWAAIGDAEPQQKPKTLECSKLIIRGPDGRVRARIEADEFGASIALFGKRENELQLALVVRDPESTAYLTLQGREGRQVFLVGKKDACGLFLFDTDGIERVSVADFPNEKGFWTKDEKGELITQIR